MAEIRRISTHKKSHISPSYPPSKMQLFQKLANGA